MTYDDRCEFAKKNGVCFVCLRKGQRWRKCFRKNSKGKREFHTLLRNSKTEINCTKTEAKSEVDDRNVETTMTHYRGTKQSLFKIVPVILYEPLSRFETYALLDDCASVTLIEEEVADKLMLNGPIKPLVMGWTKDIVSREYKTRMVKFTISGLSSSKKYKIANARTVKRLSLPQQTMNVESLTTRYPYLSGTEVS